MSIPIVNYKKQFGNDIHPFQVFYFKAPIPDLTVKQHFPDLSIPLKVAILSLGWFSIGSATKPPQLTTVSNNFKSSFCKTANLSPSSYSRSPSHSTISPTLQAAKIVRSDAFLENIVLQNRLLVFSHPL